MGVTSVLIKGGHTLKDVKYAQDFFLSSLPPVTPNEERLFESNHGVWLRSSRYVNCAWSRQSFINEYSIF